MAQTSVQDILANNGPGYSSTPPPVVGKRRRSRVPLVLGGIVSLAALGVVGGMYATKDKVPNGAVIGGVDVGGMSRDAAISTLQQRVPTAQAPLPVVVGDQQATLDPSAAGLSLDAAASVSEAIGETFSPSRLWRLVTGGEPIPASPAPDMTKLTSALQKVSESTARQAKDGDVTFSSTGPQAVAAVTAIQLDVAKAAPLVAENWLARKGPIALPVNEQEPAITQAEVDRAMREVATPAAAGDLTLNLGDKKVKVPRAAVIPTLSMAPDPKKPGSLALVVDGAALRTAVLAGQANLEAKARDAQIVLKNGVPTVIPSVDGITIDPKKLATAAATALTTPQRVITLTSAVSKPAFTTEQAQALGIKERISTFSTNLTANADRTENLRIAARAVNGTIVKPGETFSLNGVLGPRTADKGYNEAPVIMNGRLEKGRGGGVSQMATTIFNNVFFSGMQDITHTPHSFYISRYPVGREATVNYPTIDLKWKNDTPYGVLVEASVYSQVNVSFWSTKYYDRITHYTGSRRNVREPKQIYDTSEKCVEQSPSQGFEITVGRKVYRNGTVVKDNNWSTRYIPEDHVICGPKPAPAPTPAPPAGGQD